MTRHPCRARPGLPLRTPHARGYSASQVTLDSRWLQYYNDTYLRTYMMTNDIKHDLAAEVAALRSELHALDRAVRPLLAERDGRRDVAVPDGDRPVLPSRRRRGEAVAPAAEALAARAQAEGVPGFLTRYGY